MSDIPKHLLDLAAKAVYDEEADSSAACVDLYHAPLIAAAALEPVLAKLRRQVEAWYQQATAAAADAEVDDDRDALHYNGGAEDAFGQVLGLLGGEV